MVKTRSSSPKKPAKLEDIELLPDAWERFEGFVKTKVPVNRPAIASKPTGDGRWRDEMPIQEPRKTSGKPSGKKKAPLKKIRRETRRPARRATRK